MIHSIFLKPFSKWWMLMAVVTLIVFYAFGLPSMKGYEGYGNIFWVASLLFCGLIFGSILYLLCRLVMGKWNNKVFMVCIAIMWLIVLVTIRR
jgi:hypothetical protein